MNIVRLTLAAATAALLLPAVPHEAVAQERERRERPSDSSRVERRIRVEPLVQAMALTPMQQNRAAIGVYLGQGSAADTAGVAVEEVTEGGPAAQAGIVAGERIVAVNGRDIRLTRSEAADEAQQGLAARRLTRAIGEVEPGDEVTLRVRGQNGRERDVRVRTMSAAELARAAARVRMRSDSAGGQWLTVGRDDRPTIGISLQATGSVRDTLGVFVASVVPDGPADRAGIMEGDRIASIGGTDLRVRSVDAGDPYVAQLKVETLTRALRDATVGEPVELRVWRGGQVRTVRVTPAPASEVRRTDGATGAFWFPDATVTWPRAGQRILTLPRGTVRMQRDSGSVRIFRFDGDGEGDEVIIELDPEVRAEVRTRMDEAMREMRRAMESLRLRQDAMRSLQDELRRSQEQRSSRITRRIV